jgi:hypothetical protein
MSMIESSFFDKFGIKESTAWMFLSFLLIVLAGIAGLMQNRASDKEHERSDNIFKARIEEAKTEALKLESENLTLKASVATLEKETAEARTKEFETEEKAAFALRAARPRWSNLNSDSLKKELEGKPAGQVEILYKADDEETWMLATTIAPFLQDAGWKILAVRSMQEKDVYSLFSGWSKDVPLAARVGIGLGAGATIIAKHVPEGGLLFENESPLKTLFIALSSAGLQLSNPLEDTDLPEGVIRVVLGTRATF